MRVIDVGCARYGGDYSVERLLDWYRPDELLGFDPAWTDDMLQLGPPPEDAPTTPTRAMRILCEAKAAWTFDGEVRFLFDGLNSQVGDAEHWTTVPCVDLARVVEESPEGPVVLKLDAEGAEYELLEHLLDGGAIARLSRLLVEWHPRHEGQRRRAIEEGLRRQGVVYEQWRH